MKNNREIAEQLIIMESMLMDRVETTVEQELFYQKHGKLDKLELSASRHRQNAAAAKVIAARKVREKKVGDMTAELFGPIKYKHHKIMTLNDQIEEFLMHIENKDARWALTFEIREKFFNYVNDMDNLINGTKRKVDSMGEYVDENGMYIGEDEMYDFVYEKECEQDQYYRDNPEA